MLIDFGQQPPSNRFVTSAGDDGERYRLCLGSCQCCGLFQLIDPMSPAMVRSRYDWITYNEPEGHLDDMVMRLCALLDDRDAPRVDGVTYKDGTTLRRFAERGYPNTRVLAFSDGGEADGSPEGLETIQAYVNVTACTRIATESGNADIVIARHVLEHAHAPREFMQGLWALAGAGGYAVVEVPDCRKVLEAGDASFIWEEHLTYFDANSLRDFVERAGGEVVSLWTYEYAMENSLVAVTRQTPLASAGAGTRQGVFENQEGHRFLAAFEDARKYYQRYLHESNSQGRRVAAFGAGHLAAKFINLFELAPYLDCVIDDNPHKLDMLMPGSGLPIVGSDVLQIKNFGLVLMSLSPESEVRVMDAKQDYIDAGGVMKSMFSLSPHSLLRHIQENAES